MCLDSYSVDLDVPEGMKSGTGYKVFKKTLYGGFEGIHYQRYFRGKYFPQIWYSTIVAKKMKLIRVVTDKELEEAEANRWT